MVLLAIFLVPNIFTSTKIAIAQGEPPGEPPENGAGYIGPDTPNYDPEPDSEVCCGAFSTMYCVKDGCAGYRICSYDPFNDCGMSWGACIADCGSDTTDTTEPTTDTTTTESTATTTKPQQWGCLYCDWDHGGHFPGSNVCGMKYFSSPCTNKCRTDADCEELTTTTTTTLPGVITTTTTTTTLPGVTTTKPHYSGYKCRSTGCNNDSEFCKECKYSNGWTSTSGLYNTEEECETNCKYKCICKGYVEPSLPSGFQVWWWNLWGKQRHSCNISTWQCSEDDDGPYSSLTNCQDDCTPECVCTKCPSSGLCEKECKTNIDCQEPTTDTTESTTTTTTEPSTTTTEPPTTDTTEPPTTDTTEPSPPAPTCQISEFSINNKTNEDTNPLRVWVNASLKGYVSVNDSCTKCTVTSNDTWGNPPQTYDIIFIDTRFTESFEIPTSGTYFFKLLCIGDPDNPDDFDEDTASLQTVEALNLPWWQEIIPVLRGFLGGVWE